MYYYFTPYGYSTRIIVSDIISILPCYELHYDRYKARILLSVLTISMTYSLCKSGAEQACICCVALELMYNYLKII